MVVNPFFLHGSTQEQNLHQDLVNEQIRMYGLDVYYIPRTFVRDATIMREVTSSEFKSYFIIEAYLNNFDGYGGQGDIMSKFGIQVKDEVTLTLSRERFENYVAPFLNSRMLYLMNSPQEDGSLPTIHRPREGDLVYFPLGRRLFEIKFVEHEQPFYQLGKGYTYELQCELFEYEDELLDTSIDEIDSTLLDKGDIDTLSLVALSNRAEVSVGLGSGYIRKLEILNEGSGYTENPNVIIDPPRVGTDPSVVAILTIPDNNISAAALKQLVVFDSGTGYTEAPNVSVSNGRNAVIRAGINTDTLGIINFTVENQGSGYPEDARILVYNEENVVVAEGLALTDGAKIVQAVVIDPGEGLVAEELNIVVDAPAGSGEGDYTYNEIVIGKQSGTRARVRGWDGISKSLQVTNLDPANKDVIWQPGEVVEGETSGARYSVSNFDDYQTVQDGFSQNEEIQDVADEVVDTSEFNQFMPYDDNDFDSDNPFGE